jgi:hypothetical protein
MRLDEIGKNQKEKIENLTNQQKVIEEEVLIIPEEKPKGNPPGDTMPSPSVKILSQPYIPDVTVVDDTKPSKISKNKAKPAAVPQMRMRNRNKRPDSPPKARPTYGRAILKEEPLESELNRTRKRWETGKIFIPQIIRDQGNASEESEEENEEREEPVPAFAKGKVGNGIIFKTDKMKILFS